MENKPLTRPWLRAVILVVLSLLTAAAVLCALFARNYTLVGGWPVERASEELDLRDLDVRGVSGLMRLREPRLLDLRGSRLRPGQYRRLAQRFPDCSIRWDVPVGEARYDSASRSLALTAPFSAGEVERFALFPALEEVDARGLDCREAILALAAARPELTLYWDVAAPGGARFPADAAVLDFSGQGGFAPEELLTLPALFPQLTLIDVSDCGFSHEELLSLREQPELAGIELRWTFNLCGVTVGTTDTQIDLSGQPIEDVSVVEAALPFFTRLEKVIMCECGVSDEEMDALDKRHEDVRFVWMVHFGDFFLRTDATTFIATTFPYGYTYLSNEQLWPLQYCRDLVALDLGHMHYSDVSFLRSLPKLRWLILSDTNISDISMLADMPELYYLEIFLTRVTDISPLLACQNLRHLNIAYTPIRNTDVLAQMTWLERLWAPGVSFTGNAFHTLRQNEGLEFNYYTESSTGGTWRTHPAYYEMRDVFGVYYMPG